jgi:pimeloyl-ACP methyl ester carboxylesterase
VFSNQPGTPALPPLPEPAPEIALDAYLSSFKFVPFDAEPLLISEHDRDFGVLRKISLNMSKHDGRFEAYVFIPKGYKPPYQSMVYMSGDYAFRRGARMEPSIPWEVKDVFSPYLHSGRAIIWPVWHGSYERYDGWREAPNELRGVIFFERLQRWVTDTAAIVDYLDASEDFNDRVAWLGLSFGGAFPNSTHFFTPPFRTAILLSGKPLMRSPMSVSFWRRFSLPVLLLKGRFDLLSPVVRAERWIDTIGTPADDKRLVIYDANHWPMPRNQMIREVIDWLDHYLGPVD